MKTFTMTVLAVFFIITSFSSCKKPGEEKTEQAPIVRTTHVIVENERGQKEFSFIAKPFRSSELSFRVGGPIKKFDVYAGNYYRQGEIIAEIDPRDYCIRKERTEAVYRQAKMEFERIKSLYEKNNLAASVYEKAQADYISAKTAFETAENELKDTRLVAPFNGYVGEVYIEKFQDVRATQPIISFIDIEQLKIEAYVPQDVAFSSSQVKKVALYFDTMPDSIFQAQVVEISRNTTHNNLSYLLTALLPNRDERLLAGLSGKVIIGFGEKKFTTVSIPQTALCHRPTVGDYVWVINPETQKVSRRSVVVKELLPKGKVSVVKGLKAGETIAVSGLRFLSEGMTAEIREEKNFQAEAGKR